MAEEAVVSSPAPAAPPASPAAPSAPGVPAPAESGKSAQTRAGEAPATPAGEKPAEQQSKTDEQPEQRVGKSRYERRLDKAYRKAAESSARAEFFERQLNEFRQQQQAPTDPNAPRLSDFDDIEKFASAREKYAADKALKQLESQRTAQTQRHMQEAIASRWESSTDRGEEKYPDFAEKVGDIKPTTPWAIGLMSAENAEDIAYHLGSNLQEAQRIISLPPVEQLLEIGKLSAKLSSPAEKPKQPSKAPAPINPLSGTGNSDAAPSDKDDIKTWVEKRNAQIAAKRRAGILRI